MLTSVHFDKKLQQWDGCGVNYVELAQSTTTKWMRYFVREGLKKTGRELPIITTLYGPPSWATKQKFLRGRDLDPEQYRNLALYMIDWVKFLKEKEGHARPDRELRGTRAD